jgi:hypothetical protein
LFASGEVVHELVCEIGNKARSPPVPPLFVTVDDDGKEAELELELELELEPEVECWTAT